MKKYFIVLFLTILIIPSVAFASWWNPFSWSWFKKTTSTVPALNLRLSDDSPATSTLSVNFMDGERSSRTSIGVFGIKTKNNTTGWITNLSFKINSKEGYLPKNIITRASLSCRPLSSTSKEEWSTDGNIMTFKVSGARLSKEWGDCELSISPKPITTPITISATLVANMVRVEGDSGKNLDVSNINDITSNEITLIPE